VPAGCGNKRKYHRCTPFWYSHVTQSVVKDPLYVGQWQVYTMTSSVLYNSHDVWQFRRKFPQFEFPRKTLQNIVMQTEHHRAESFLRS
jgi:hypothetical protein